MKSINQDAPVLCRKKIIINANTVDVWKILTDINRWNTWQADIKKPVLKGEVVAGSTFEWISGGLKIRSTIHTAQPYSVFGWTGKTLGLYAIHNWKITELNKQSEVAVEESMEGLLAGFFKKLFNKSLEKGMVRWLDMLKKECEKRTNPES
jgi:hypothetical protein